MSPAVSNAMGNPQRRAHKKSKLGCLTCKKRHVRCDELYPTCQHCQRLGLECIRANDRQSLNTNIIHQAQFQLRSVTDPNATTSATPAALPSSRALISSPVPRSGAVSPLTQSLTTHGLPPEWSARDSRFMYGIVQVVAKMQHHNGHLLSLGASGLPMLVESAFHFDFARYTLLSFLTLHLAHLYKSSQLQRLTQIYRITAFGTLAEALSHFSRKNADAILGTAIMLAYTSDGEREHKHLENGVSAILIAMQPMKHLSKFPQYFRGPYSLVRPLQGHPNEPLSIPKARKLEPEVSQAILNGMQQTKGLFAGLPAFQEAVQNLWFVIYNVSGMPRMSNRQQYQIHDSLRTLKFIGVEVLADFGRASPTELLLMALQELVMLVVEELRPDTSWAYSILAHADVVVTCHGRLSQRLAEGVQCVRPELHLEIMDVPYKIASTYQTYGRIALE